MSSVLAPQGEVKQAMTPLPQRAHSPPRPRVFVVDDDALARRAITDLLPAKFEVLEFETGEAALSALALNWPDAVLLDVVLPGLDGVEICRRMKQRAGDLPLPVVLMTARESTSEQARGFEAGADDFLRKPFHQGELRCRVGNLVKLAVIQRQQGEADLLLNVMRGQLEAADRLATLGTFAGGVGHELNNVATVLRSVEGEVQHSALADDAKVDLRDATVKLQELARALQRIARPAQVEQQVDVREIVRDVLWMTRITGRTKYLAVELDLPPAAVVARLVPVQVQQLVLSLVTNAADALTNCPAGRIQVSLACEAGLVRLRVSDNGPGLSAEAQRNVFEPTFTAKPPGLGTGLGLVLVRQLVTAWGGTVSLKPLGEGTTLEVTFPAERGPRPC
jgi:C4-dicarboxylate-specific signal transduction histidine kinase